MWIIKWLKTNVDFVSNRWPMEMVIILKINSLNNCSMRQFSISLPLHKDSTPVLRSPPKKKIRGVTGIRMHVTCQQGANRIRRHLYSIPDNTPHLAGWNGFQLTRSM